MVFTPFWSFACMNILAPVIWSLSFDVFSDNFPGSTTTYHSLVFFLLNYLPSSQSEFSYIVLPLYYQAHKAKSFLCFLFLSTEIYSSVSNPLYQREGISNSINVSSINTISLSFPSCCMFYNSSDNALV